MSLDWTDAAVQGLVLILAVSLLFFLQSIPARLRRRRRSSTTSAQAHRHFITGAQLLARARSSSPPSVSLAKSALSNADLAISLSPRDAAPYILKALTLDLLGRPLPALKSLDTALAPPVVSSLSDRERGDALFKRAELQVKLNGRRTKRRIDAAVLDLKDAVKLSLDNSKAFVMLGECYEERGEMEEAREAFEAALRIGDGAGKKAREGIKRVEEKWRAGESVNLCLFVHTHLKLEFIKECSTCYVMEHKYEVYRHVKKHRFCSEAKKLYYEELKVEHTNKHKLDHKLVSCQPAQNIIYYQKQNYNISKRFKESTNISA
ncbi:hypothetical protein LUZ60_003752 [Juncus effusus]|nr:hypothetical protein LUZ60_003752 [Juncus effusus]